MMRHCHSTTSCTMVRWGALRSTLGRRALQASDEAPSCLGLPHQKAGDNYSQRVDCSWYEDCASVCV